MRKSNRRSRRTKMMSIWTTMSKMTMMLVSLPATKRKPMKRSRLKRLSKMRKRLGRTSMHLSTMSIRRRWTCTMMNKKTTTSRTRNKMRASQIKMSRGKPLSQLSQSMRLLAETKTKRKRS